ESRDVPAADGPGPTRDPAARPADPSAALPVAVAAVAAVVRRVSVPARAAAVPFGPARTARHHWSAVRPVRPVVATAADPSPARRVLRIGASVVRAARPL